MSVIKIGLRRAAPEHAQRRRVGESCPFNQCGWISGRRLRIPNLQLQVKRSIYVL